MYDPEAAIRIVGEAAIACHLVSYCRDQESLRIQAEHLDRAVTRLMGTVASRYGRRGLAERLTTVQVTENDREWVRRLDPGLRTGLRERYQGASTDDYKALELAARLRLFLTELERITHWGPEDEPSSDAYPPWRL